MKIAIATLFDVQDVRRGSGTYYYMSREFERQGHRLEYIGPFEFQTPLISRILRSISKRLHRRYITYLDPFVAANTGRQATKRLVKLDYDILLTNDFAIAGCTSARKPIMVYTDVMLTHDYIERYVPASRLSNILPCCLPLFRQTIKRGIKRADLCVFPTKGAADEAIQYSGSSEKIFVVPNGANVRDPGRRITEERNFTKLIQKDRIDLLFVGKDWIRKGGDVVVLLARELNARNVKAHLHIVGALPLQDIHYNYIHTYGLLDKSVGRDLNTLEHLYQMCDALILPSQSEGFGIVLLEAAAYGLPVIAYDVPGVAEAVQHEKSGILLPLGVPAARFADVILNWLHNPAEYYQLVIGARKHFEETANWKRAVMTLVSIIERYLSGTRQKNDLF